MYVEARLREAADAASLHDPEGMIKSLYESRFPDHLTQHLSARWSWIPRMDIEECVSQAVYEMFRHLKSGKEIWSVRGFLWTVANRLAAKEWERRQREIPYVPDELEKLAHRHAHALARGFVALPFEEERIHEEDEEAQCTAQALAISRELLPKLGGPSVQAVMRQLFGAIEEGKTSLPVTQIARATGLTPSYVRKAAARGLCRLARIAQTEAISLGLAAVVQIHQPAS